MLCSLRLTRAFNAILGAWPGRSCGAGAVLQVFLRNVHIFKKDCGCGGFWGYNFTKKHPRATRFWERRDQKGPGSPLPYRKMPLSAPRRKILGATRSKSSREPPRCETRSRRPYSGVLPSPGVRLTAWTRTRSGHPHTVVVPEAKINQKQLDRASSLVPGGVMVEEGPRGAPVSEGMMVPPLFQGYDTASRQAPSPLLDKIAVCEGPAEQPWFGLVLNQVREILGDKHAPDAFAHILEQNQQMPFYLDTSPGEVCHFVGPIPDDACLDPEIRKLVGALLRGEGLAEKLTAHLVTQSYTRSNEPSTFFLEKNDSGGKMITSNIEQEIKGSLYLHEGRVVRCNRSAKGTLFGPFGLPGSVPVMITILADLTDEGTTKIAGVKDSKADNIYPGNLTARTVAMIRLMVMDGDPRKTRDILLRACRHLRSQAYQVGFFC